MRFIFANNYFYLRGGAERVFLNEISMLQKHGHEVIPFSRRHEKNDFSEYSKYFAPDIVYDNVTIRGKILVSSKLIYSGECKKRFDDLLGIIRPNVVHAHNVYGRLTSSIIDASKKRSIPVVMTLHDYKLICPSYLMLSNGQACELCYGKRFFYCAVKRCHRGSVAASVLYTFESYFNVFCKKYDWIRYFICPSKFLLNKHGESGIPENKLVHVPNVVNASEFEPDHQGGEYILFVGRLSKEKGIITLLKALKGLDVRLRIAGDGPMLPECVSYVKENNIINVKFEGYKSGEELRNIYRKAAFVVFPSECYENAPMTILEAFAYGKPVIGTNIGGIPELVADNVTGLLFEPGDHEMLQEKIEYLLCNPSLTTQMGKKARQKIEMEYNAEMHYDKLIEVYSKACS